MIIAIDGPAGAGKSTVCRMLAKELGVAYLDTGAMYRAIAWALIEEGCGVEDPAAVEGRLAALPLRFVLEGGALAIYYRGRAVEEELRRPEMAQYASRVSRIPAVRSFLTDWQRRLAERGSVVAEGRDMTTVVFPDAPVKVYLTADLPTRARRRRAEYLRKGIPIDYGELEAQIRARDEADEQRDLAPLRPAPDALILDTAPLEIPDVVHRLLEYIQEKASEKT